MRLGELGGPALNICGGGGLLGLAAMPPPNDMPPCCYSSAEGGPADCTCWEPVYDVVQAPPRTDETREVQPAPCGDCAYRGGSPERRGDPLYHGTEDGLDALVQKGQPFYCHAGMRRIVAIRHPSGVELPILRPEDSYDPPMVGLVPFRADGSPGLICGGWAERRRHLVAAGQR